MLKQLVDVCLPALGEAASTTGRSGVGGISTTGKREGNGNCADQTRTVTEVGSADVSGVILSIIWFVLLFYQLFADDEIVVRFLQSVLVNPLLISKYVLGSL